MNRYTVDGITVLAYSYNDAVRIARTPQHVWDKAIDRALDAFDVAMAHARLPAPPKLPADMCITIRPIAR